ncbi:MAG: ArsR/SmtB family transcription factor [Minisyncoccia bacterium]
MKKHKNLLSLNEHQLLDFLKIISDEERFKIIHLLYQKSYCVCELSQLLDLPQNLISYHLKVLKDFRIINLKKNGRKNFYSLNMKILSSLCHNLNKNLT